MAIIKWHAGFYGYDVYIPESVWDTVKEWETIIMATPTFNHRNYTGVEEEGRYINGWAGELSVCNMLETFGKRFKHNPPNLKGKSNGGWDIMVWGNVTSRTIAVDVKTAGTAGQRKMRVSVEQMRLYKPEIYLSCQIIGHHWCAMHGWLWRRELEKREAVKEKGLNKQCPFEELHHMDELLNSIQNVGHTAAQNANNNKPKEKTNNETRQDASSTG